MSLHNVFSNSIARQFLTNRKKNIFYKGLDYGNHFLPESKTVIDRYRNDLLEVDRLHQSGIWIEMMTDIAMQTFCQANQFMDFREVQIEALREIYALLWRDILLELRGEVIDFNKLQKDHLIRLTQWLTQYNPFLKEINSADLPEVADVVCAEYSALLQIELLHLDSQKLMEPVLDIGCGSQARLVNHFRDLGVDAYGIDRFCEISDSFLFRSNWLEYDFQPNHWGTLISNLSFAMHFSNHNLRKDGEYVIYAQKYMEILASLKPGGTFYYVPALPFIEVYLPKEQYQIIREKVHGTFFSTRILKLL